MLRIIKKLCIYLFLLSQLVGSSQNRGTIKGKVIDKQTRTNLSFVNVIVIGSSIGAILDENGDFVINNVPLGYAKVQALYLGYSTTISEDYLVTNDKNPLYFYRIIT